MAERVLVESVKGLHDGGIEVGARTVVDLGDHLVVGHRLLVGPLVAHRVKGIGQRDDASGQRDRVARESARIAASVPALVMAERDLGGDLKQRRWAVGHDLRTDL